MADPLDIPMTTLARLMNRGIKRMERLTGNQTFVWKGLDVICTPSSERVGNTIVFGGFEREITLTLIVRRAHFLTVDTTLITIDSTLYTADDDRPTPVAGRTLSFRGASYRILSARQPASLSHYELDLGDVNR